MVSQLQEGFKVFDQTWLTISKTRDLSEMVVRRIVSFFKGHD